MPFEIHLKRAYDGAEDSDGRRILVERLWPRGIRKADARIDFWSRNTAPSTELRQWYGHNPERWPEFQTRYTAELLANAEAVAELRRWIDRDVTFVFGSRERVQNSATVLRDHLQALWGAE